MNRISPDPHENFRLIVVVGPTAVGKTAAAIQLAKTFDTVVISADSRQFYREMNIGTAKPSEEELSEVDHFFINSHGIEDNLSAGTFEREALSLLNELRDTYSVVVVVGGSGLFINALLYGLDDLPKPLPGIREKWNHFYKENGIEALQKALKKADYEYFLQVDLQNPQRLIRALEVYESSGKPFSGFRRGGEHRRDFNTTLIGLDMPRDALYDRINQRVDSMMDDGLLNEVRRLEQYRHLPALKTVGYAELFDYLDGIHSLEDAVAKIKRNTRRYAKRQLTWFKRTPQITWFTPNDLTGMVNLIKNG